MASARATLWPTGSAFVNASPSGWGLPVCVGIGPTKTLAKFANHLAKKNASFQGVCDITALNPAERDQWMAGNEVGEVWGVGRRISKRLSDMGIATVLDLKCADQEHIRRAFNVVLQKTVEELNGTSCLPLELIAPAKLSPTAPKEPPNVHRNGATFMWSNGHRTWGFRCWILPVLRGWCSLNWEVPVASGRTGHQGPGSKRCDAAGPGWPKPTACWRGRPGPTRGSPGCW